MGAVVALVCLGVAETNRKVSEVAEWLPVLGGEKRKDRKRVFSWSLAYASGCDLSCGVLAYVFAEHVR